MYEKPAAAWVPPPALFCQSLEIMGLDCGVPGQSPQSKEFIGKVFNNKDLGVIILKTGGGLAHLF